MNNTAESEVIAMKHNEPETEQVLSENSPIRLGLILGLFSVCVATIGAAWYLASALTKIETKLDAIGIQVAATSSAAVAIERRQTEHEKDDNTMWRGLETRVSIIEKIGSPKIPELEKKINDMDYELKVLQLKPWAPNGNGTKP